MTSASKRTTKCLYPFHGHLGSHQCEHQLAEARAMAEHNEPLSAEFYIDANGDVQYKPDRSNTTTSEPTEARVERVARAILKCAINDVGREYPDWDTASPQNREIALKCARAAIDALDGPAGRGDV